MAFRENSFRYRFGGIIRFCIISVVIALGLGLFYGLTLLGPRNVSPEDVVHRKTDAAIMDVLTRSEELEQAYLAIDGLREPTDADLDLLEQAIDLQKQYISGIGGFDREANERLVRLESLYQEQAAKQLWVESVEQERRANSFAASEPPLKGLKNLRRAMALQQRINIEFPKSSRRNVTRAIRLEREFTKLSALPLYEETLAEEAAALAAIEIEDWAAARQHYSQAIAAQKKINMEYRGLMYADLNRLKDLEVDLDSLESSELYGEIADLIDKGEQAFRDKAYRQSGDFYQKAARLQAKLNDEFASSRFASRAKLEKLEALNQTALSQELGEDILGQVEQLDAYLRGRNHWRAVEIINGLFQKAEKFKENFPRSRILSNELLLKLQYLSFIQEDIAFFQDRIYGQLLPVPGMQAVQMATTEVSQAFYASIMLTNPSRHKGERLPVDSVNYFEAQEFCQKLSWVLAREVRLPRKSEFRAGVGSLRYVKLDAIAWFAENCDGSSQKVRSKQVNAQGFYDLLGNVAEWLESDQASEAMVAGGSAGDSIDFLADIPIAWKNAISRNRLTGFRYIVLVDVESE